MAQDVVEYFGWLSLVAVSLLLCWLVVVAIQRWKRSGRMQCPVCAEWIQARAVKCRFCGAELRPAEQPPDFPNQGAAPVVAAQPVQPAPSIPPPSSLGSAPLSPASAWQQPAEPAAASASSARVAPPAPPLVRPADGEIRAEAPGGVRSPEQAALPSVLQPSAPPVLEPSISILQPSMSPEPAPAAPEFRPAAEATPAAQTQSTGEPAMAPTLAEISTAPVQPPQAADIAPERSEVAAGIERMRHTPAEQQPPGFYAQVLGWLHDPDPRVREEAVRYLARHCSIHDDAEHLLEMVARDSDSEVRRAAAECLGGIFRATRNREVNDVLAGVARNPQEEGAVRATAYAAIKRINGYGR